MRTVTVVSPSENVGRLARLMDGTTTGRTPLPYQYSGRHIKYWKVLIVPVEKLAAGVTGRIQVGAVPGASAQVSVPACGVPLAGGAEPNAPVVPDTEPLELALEQAARPVAATRAHDASAVARRAALTGEPAALRSALRPCPGFRAPVPRCRFIAPTFHRDQLHATGPQRGVRPGWRAGASILNSQLRPGARTITSCYRCEDGPGSAAGRPGPASGPGSAAVWPRSRYVLSPGHSSVIEDGVEPAVEDIQRPRVLA